MKHKKSHVLIAILSFIFLTIPLAILDVIVKILGIPIVALTLPFSKVEEPPEWHWRPNLRENNTYEGWVWERLPYPFQYIWGSDSYGARGNWIMADRNPESFWTRFDWLAIRNAASNWGYLPHMRYRALTENIRYFGDPKIDDNNGITGWRFTYDVSCPWRSGFVILKRYGKTNRSLWARVGWLQYSDGGEHQIPTLKSTLIPHFFKELPPLKK